MTKKGLVKGFTQPACSHRSSYVFYDLANSYEVNRTKTYDCKKKIKPQATNVRILPYELASW